MTITTTLNRIRAHRPCLCGWEKLLKGLGKTGADDEPLSYSRIVEINGLDDALWACRAEASDAAWAAAWDAAWAAAWDAQTNRFIESCNSTDARDDQTP